MQKSIQETLKTIESIPLNCKIYVEQLRLLSKVMWNASQNMFF